MALMLPLSAASSQMKTWTGLHSYHNAMDCDTLLWVLYEHFLEQILAKP